MKAVLFDMDGVLVDSEKFIAKAAIQNFSELGVSVNELDFKPFVGSGEDRYLGGVADKYNIHISIEELKKRTYAIYDQMVKGKLHPLEGVKSFILKCKNKGFKLALATSADKVKMLINLREIDIDPNTFNVLVNGLDVKNKKPDPEIFLLAAKKLGVNINECLVVEDAINGVQAAKLAGAKCLALTTSFSNNDLHEADWITNHLGNVPSEAISW